MKTKLRYDVLASSALLLAVGCTFDTNADSTDESTDSVSQPVCQTYPDCGPEPDPDDPPPPPPPPLTSRPDVGLQFSPCLPDTVTTQLTDVLRGALPDAKDIRTTCSGGTHRVGVWFALTSGADDGNARQRGLVALSLLLGSETFSGYVNSRYINKTVNTAWNATPKVVNPDGTPSSGGPIHLTSLQVNYLAPNQIASVIRGYDERPWPDVAFTLTTTDTLSTVEGRIQCDSVPNLNADVSWRNYLTTALGIVIPPLGLYLVLDGAFPSSSDTTTSAGSVACPAVKVFPAEIMLPLGVKVVVSYGRAQASTAGIVVGGTYEVVRRTPSATIVGSRALRAEPLEPTSYGAYAARTRDMRAPLVYRWSSTGTVANPTVSGTGITFSLAHHNQLGNVKTDRVSVQVTDADGLSASVSTTVLTTIRSAVTPVCENKPYLPQCQEP